MKSLSSTNAASLGLARNDRNLSRLAICTLLFLIVILFSVTSFAQQGTIVGTVTDPSGAAVPNVKVTLTNAETGGAHIETTNSSGQYVAPDIHIGHYTVRGEATGFKVAEEKDVVLQVGDRIRIDLKLEIGSVQQVIVVEAHAVAVQTDTGEVSSVVTGQQITQLATNGRNVFALEGLTPGATSIQADFQVPTSAGGDFNVSFNGQRVSHNLWLVDGGEAADRGGGGGADVLPSIYAIQEFRTMTSNYSAEYGLSSGGTMSMAIKSGTKQLHASGWYFGRNDALDARNYFNPPPQSVAELRLHDFGFNVGGPVSFHPSKSNPKTFFFYNMEWRRFIQGGVYNVTVPYTQTYGGNFTGFVPANSDDPLTGNPVPNSGLHVPCASQLSPALIATFATAGITTLSQPSSNGACAIPSLSQRQGGATLPVFQAFSGNAIPSTLLDPNGQLLVNAGLFPAPTSGQSFLGGNKQPTTGKEEIARIDHQFTEKFSIFGHWISDQALQTFGTTMWSGDNLPTVGNTFGNPSFSAVVHATYAIRPNLLNEVAFNYDGNRIHILPKGLYTQPSGWSVPQVFANADNVDNRIPDINLSGVTNDHYTVNWMPWNNTANDYQIRDDLSWVKGAQQIKFGFGWALYSKAQDYFAETQGGFTFNGNYTGNDFADFLIGYAQGYNENAYKGTGHWTAISPDAYVQDDWRATSRLTLNLGLRWDGIPHTYEANYDQANFYPNLYSQSALPIWANAQDTQIATNSPGLGTSPIQALSGYQFYLNGMGIGGKSGLPRGLVGNSWWNFGPRLGFAYDVFGTGKTVFRGGYGLMYERIQGNDMYNGATNPPFGNSFATNYVLLSNPNQAIPGGTITVPIVPGSVTGINRNYPTPRNSQFSLGLQQAVGTRAVFSVSYVGSEDRHQSYWQEINLPPFADLANLQGGTSATPFNGLVPYQGYTQIKQAFTGGNSHYNSLQTELHGRVARDLTLQAAYTWSRSIDATTGNGGNGWDLDYISNPYAGWRYDLGASPLDRTNVFFVNFVYDIPFLKSSSNSLLKSTVGGWQVSGIVSAMSGQPYNLGINGTNVASVFPGGDVANRPQATAPTQYEHAKVYGSNNVVTGIQWVNPAIYSVPTAGTWGNTGFDSVRGPGRDNWNLSLFKSFVINEARGSRFEFRAESFNTWNHTQFGGSGQNGGFSNNFGSGNFGQVTSAFDPRVLQLGAKLIF